MFSDLKKHLMEIGLTEKQTIVYLTCLQLGLDTVARVAKFSGLKRPTTYLILDELEKIGLVGKIKKEHRIMIKAEDPKNIITNLRSKKETAENILPSLQAIYNLNPAKPHIKIGEGIESVRNVYNEIFTYLQSHPQEKLLIFGSLKDACEHFESQVVNYFYRSMARTKNAVREIGNDDHETRKYYRASAKLNPNHEIKLIRQDGRFTETDNMLYGNTLVIFSVKEQIFATTIVSATITETYRTLFNMAWRSGKPI
ncbi:MAG: helix-turn-helix domain-containing protein [Candidatus Uhrbacteria bacterium]